MKPQNLDLYLEHNQDPELSKIAKAVKAAALEIRELFAKVDPQELGTTNPSGDHTLNLDREASAILTAHIEKVESVWGILSEEEEDIIKKNDTGEYFVAMDPLDGSSIVESGFAVGSMIGIYKQSPKEGIFSGKHLVGAIYVVYGSSTFMGMSFGNGLHIFREHGDGTWYPVRDFVRLNGHSHIAALGGFDTMAYVDGYKELALKLSRDHFKLRYSGSLTADIHQLFMQGGGLFIHHSKKLRLLYECAPVAFLLQQAGGHATNGVRNLMQVETTNLHETTLFLGGTKEVVDMAMTIL